MVDDAVNREELRNEEMTASKLEKKKQADDS